MRKRRMISAALMVALFPFGIPPAFAEGYPSKPIRILYGFGTGGGPDVVGRVLGKKLQDQMGQPVVFENKPGATGTIAAAMGAKAAPDGHTIVLVTPTHVIAPNYMRHLSYDPLSSFEPVAMVASQPLFLAVSASSPIRTVKDLIELARSKPGTINYATPGIGSPQHLAAELFAVKSGIRLVHVPYKSGGEMTVALLAGEVQMMFLSLAPMAPHVESGKLRALAVTSETRYPALPDVPAFPEVGLADAIVDNWIGVIAPVGTPASAIKTLDVQIAKAMRDPDMAERLQQQGAMLNHLSAAEFSEFLRREAAKWSQAAKASSAKAN